MYCTSYTVFIPIHAVIILSLSSAIGFSPITNITTHRTILPLIVGFLVGSPLAAIVVHSETVVVSFAGVAVLVAEVLLAEAQLATEGNGGVPGIET
jgi:hypothetical protein